MKKNLLFVYLSAVIFLTGCTITSKPVFLDASFKEAGIEEITVLPYFDNRRDKSCNIDISRIFKKEVGRFLKQLKYNYRFVPDYGPAKEITEEDIEIMSPDWIKKLGPEESRTVLLVVWEDFNNPKSYGIRYSCELSGYLFDKREGKLLWKNKSVEAGGQGGVGGLFYCGMQKKNAIKLGIMELFLNLPKNE
jgi:hypothetical protein